MTEDCRACGQPATHYCDFGTWLCGGCCGNGCDRRHGDAEPKARVWFLPEGAETLAFDGERAVYATEEGVGVSNAIGTIPITHTDGGQA